MSQNYSDESEIYSIPVILSCQDRIFYIYDILDCLCSSTALKLPKSQSTDVEIGAGRYQCLFLLVLKKLEMFLTCLEQSVQHNSICDVGLTLCFY